MSSTTVPFSQAASGTLSRLGRPISNGYQLWLCLGLHYGVGVCIVCSREARDAPTPEPLYPMNTQLSTVYPDVDAAAYVWPPQNNVDEDADSWLKRMMIDYCNKTIDCLCDETLSASYKVGYSKAYVKGLKRLIQLSQV